MRISLKRNRRGTTRVACASDRSRMSVFRRCVLLMSERGRSRGRGWGRGGRGRGRHEDRREAAGRPGGFPRPPGGGAELWPFQQPNHVTSYSPGYVGIGRGFVQGPPPMAAPAHLLHHYPPFHAPLHPSTPLLHPTTPPLYPSTPPRHPSTPHRHLSTPHRYPTPHRRYITPFHSRSCD